MAVGTPSRGAAVTSQSGHVVPRRVDELNEQSYVGKSKFIPSRRRSGRATAQRSLHSAGGGVQLSRKIILKWRAEESVCLSPRDNRWVTR